MSNWAFLESTDAENREERYTAKQLAEASLQRANNKGFLLQALLQKLEPANALTTQDIENYQSSSDRGPPSPVRTPLKAPSDASTIPGELPHDVPKHIEHPRKVSGKQNRAVQLQKLFLLSSFVAKTRISPDEEKIISELRASNLNELIHKLATALLDFAQDVVPEEHEPWFVSVKLDFGHATDSDE